MKNYFQGCETVSEVKSQYRKLAMEHRPDHGGDTATMQEINAQYFSVLAFLDGTTEKGTDGMDHRYTYNREHEASIVAKIDELLALRLDGCDIWLIGKWVWVRGDTKPHREDLKGAGLIWHGKRFAWYWRPYEYSGYRYNERKDFTGLAQTYGAEFVKQDQDDQDRKGRKDQDNRKDAAMLAA